MDRVENLTPRSNWVSLGKGKRAGLISGECPTPEDRKLLTDAVFVDCRILKKDDEIASIKFPFGTLPDLYELKKLAKRILILLIEDKLVYVHGNKECGRANLVCGYVMMTANQKAPADNVIALLSSTLKTRKTGSDKRTFCNVEQYRAMNLFDQVGKRENLCEQLIEQGVFIKGDESYEVLLKMSDEHNKNELLKELVKANISVKGDESFKELAKIADNHNKMVREVQKLKKEMMSKKEEIKNGKEKIEYK